jgi:serine/threonine-protein kinase
MAPEQALGQVRTIGPAADIYALGAILYELLTGRPPFRGETATETERQVISEEPVRPARLNAKVPRDLETICLKCLHKDPQRRYATAAALAEDLRRFQAGQPILARPAGVLERLGKWVRRRPTQAAMLAASLVVAVVLAGGGVWLLAQQAHQREVLEAELNEVAGLRDNARWREAQAALNRADSRLAWAGSGHLRERLAQARRDLDLVIRLDGIRLKRVTRGELTYYKARANQDYAEAFEQAELGTVSEEPSRVAARIDASAVRGALLAAVHDWLVCAPDKAQRGWLFAVVRHTGSAREGWRERVLDPAAWEDQRSLAELARTAPVEQESIFLLLALGERLRAAGGDAAPLLRRVQKEHPTDFWANLILGNAIVVSIPQEAIGYYRAALASRPGEAVGYCAVGDALRFQNHHQEAMDYFQKALQQDSRYARAHSNIGDAWRDQGRPDKAIGYYREALEFDPDYAWAHCNLGNVLRTTEQFDDAYQSYQKALRLDPSNLQIHNGIRSILLRQGRGKEAQVGWQKLLEANPPEHDAWFGYAELCLFLGQPEEYQRARRDLLDRFGTTTNPYIAEPVGRAVLLLPGTEEELRQGAALTELAVKARGSIPGWIYRYFLFARGLAEYRQGHLGSAISVMDGEASRVLGPAPRLVKAMAQYAQGQKKQARKTLARAVVAFDWSTPEADRRDIWICHILRREAEGLILPNLPAFLRGEYQPVDNDERLSLVGICQFQGRCHAAARLYADAFASDPGLVEEFTSACRSRIPGGDNSRLSHLESLTTDFRYPAARCAALAGCGLSEDGVRLSELERSRWREQARDWLRADLAEWTRTVDSGSRGGRVLAGKMLTHWPADPGLSGVREASTLDELPPGERQEWRRLWSDVEALLGRAWDHE